MAAIIFGNGSWFHIFCLLYNQTPSKDWSAVIHCIIYPEATYYTAYATTRFTHNIETDIRTRGRPTPFTLISSLSSLSSLFIVHCVLFSSTQYCSVWLKLIWATYRLTHCLCMPLQQFTATSQFPLESGTQVKGQAVHPAWTQGVSVRHYGENHLYDTPVRPTCSSENVMSFPGFQHL